MFCHTVKAHQGQSLFTIAAQDFAKQHIAIANFIRRLIIFKCHWQDAAACQATVLHPRDNLLPDIAPLFKINRIQQIKIRLMRK